MDSFRADISEKFAVILYGVRGTQIFSRNLTRPPPCCSTKTYYLSTYS